MQKLVKKIKFFEVLNEFATKENANFSDDWVLQQDGASPKLTMETQKRLEDSHIEVIKWAPKSPDLSPNGKKIQKSQTKIEKVGPIAKTRRKHL